MEKIKFTAEENSFIVEAEGKKLRVSYAEFFGNYKDSMKFCKENGGGDETVENLRFLAKYRDAINEELVNLDKEKISGWYWSNEVTWWRDDCAFVENTYDGLVGDVYRDDGNYARAVSAL
jgi:hypothetical protein